jgi:hypothetical protein
MKTAPFRCLPNRKRHAWKRDHGSCNGVLTEHCVCGGKRFFRHTGGHFGCYVLDRYEAPT